MPPATDAPSIGVRALIAELTELPANPSVAMRVLRLLDDPRTDAARLGRLVEADPAMSAHTLRLANAPIHGLNRRITSARHAVMVLGFELVRSLAALTAGGVLGNGRRAAPVGFWEHSLACAAGSMVVARETGRSLGDACSAGLLHDLGAALQHRAAPAVYEAMVAASRTDPIARLDAERVCFELDHAEAGAAVLAAWNFPEDLVAVLGEHHRLPVPDTVDLVLVARAGEALADRLATVDPGESIPDIVESLASAGIDDPDLDALTDEVRHQSESLQSILS